MMVIKGVVVGWTGPMPNAEGREVGYAVGATCDFDGCEEKIDRGLSYCCGEMHDGGEHGCGGYFCYSHLFMGRPEQLCEKCLSAFDALHVESEL